MLKRKLAPVLAVLALLCTAAASAVAVSVWKEMNAAQEEAERGSVDQVEQMEDFQYTHIETAGTASAPAGQKDETPAQPGAAEEFVPETHELLADPKASIYNKMLNSIDYFNNVSLTMETSMLGDEATTVEYRFDIQAGVAYQSEKTGDAPACEIYSEGSNMIFVNNQARTYTQHYLPTYTRDDTPYIPLEARITTAEDGIPTYTYRKNVTNCPLASYSVFPQEIAFSYLKNFDKWEITDGDVTFLDRSCVKITGTPSPYIAGKHNIDSFTMLVDSATGILLDFAGSSGETVSSYITVTECSLESRTAVPLFHADDYTGYTESYR